MPLDESQAAELTDYIRPASYYGGGTEPWTCIFPGKMGISWKLAWRECGTKGEAEEQAAKNCNVVAVPLALWLRYKEYEHCLVVAKQKLLDELGLRLDYVVGPDAMYGEPTFVSIRPPQWRWTMPERLSPGH